MKFNATKGVAWKKYQYFVTFSKRIEVFSSTIDTNEFNTLNAFCERVNRKTPFISNVTLATCFLFRSDLCQLNQNISHSLSFISNCRIEHKPSDDLILFFFFIIFYFGCIPCANKYKKGSIQIGFLFCSIVILVLLVSYLVVIVGISSICLYQ